MYNLKVELGDKTYPLFIGIDILSKLGEIYQLYGFSPRAVLITDLSSKERVYFDTVCEIFEKIKTKIIPLFLTAQQVEKGFPTVNQVVPQLIKYHFQPDETLISLGGSKIGNICAFASQVLYGGVPYVQIPTTLTAKVVQSVDTMCHLNFSSILNLILTRYERNLVWSDVSVLKSLPAKNFVCGLGHIVHYACLLGDQFFEFLEDNLDDIFELDLDLIEEMIFRSCEAKMKLFKQSRADQKISQQQSFGEFVAFILMGSTQNQIKLGEALLFGMLIECDISFRKGILNAHSFERLYELIKRISNNYSIAQIDPEKFINYLERKLTQTKLPPLYLLQEFGQFIPYSDYKLSDFASAIEFILKK